MTDNITTTTEQVVTQEETVTTQNPIINDDELLNKLTTQLLYYFSNENLSTDTYLKTIMGLNSGYVPVTILSNFSKITLIIHKAITDTIQEEDEIDRLLSSLDVPALLRQAATKSDLLEVVVLNQNGTVQGEDEEDVNDSDSTRKTKITLFAIGALSTILSSELTGTTSDNKTTTEPSSSPSSLRLDSAKGNTTSAASADLVSIVILRDVPSDATEKDIRSIFKSEGESDTDSISSKITDIQREVGNCWFVTFDSSQGQKEMVDLLLSLKSRTILNESVKARLKTQRIGAATSTTDSDNNHDRSNKGDATAAPSSYNPYRYNSNNKTKSSGAGNASKGGFYNQQQVYSGDRVYYGNSSGGGNKKHYNKATSGSAGGRFVAGGYNKSSRSGGNTNTNNKSTNNGMKSHPSSGSLSGKGNNNDTGTKKIAKEADKKIEIPSASCEKHFPSLGGGMSPKSTMISSSDEELNNKKADREDNKNNATTVENEATDTSPVEDIIPTQKHTPPSGGYAAALLKAAPAGDVTSTTAKEDATAAAPPQSPRPLPRKMVQKSDAVSTRSTGTNTTDDASSDDKSSMSSKPDCDKGSSNMNSFPSPTVVTTTANPGGWGGGRSFAEILKQEE